MTPAELESRAAVLYGLDWQTPLARRIRVEPRTVRRWKAGDREIPDWVEWAIGVLERHGADDQAIAKDNGKTGYVGNLPKI